MVDYIGVETMRALIAEIGFAEAIEGIATEIERDYRRWNAFDKSPRHAVHGSDGVIELMPISDGSQYAFKYVNGHPQNTARGLLTVTAFGVLADVATGYPVLLSELTLTTALRTAAMSALAARSMARGSSRTMALIGNGAQSEFQAIAFHRMLGIDTLRLHDIDAGAMHKLERNLRGALPSLRITCCASVADAIDGADIVTTITADKRNATIVTPGLVRPGMHLNAVGGDCPGKTELHRDILLRPDLRIVVEYAPQTRVEGEIQQLAADFPVIEFADVIRGLRSGRDSDGEVTLFDSVGFALEDFSSLRYLHRALATRPHLRARLDLLPVPVDPKDLFALLAPVSAVSHGEGGPQRAVTLIGAPTDVGASVRGASLGPEALRIAGLAAVIAQNGIDVDDAGDLRGPRNPESAAVDGYRHLDEVATWNHLVHDAVAQVLARRRIPVLLGGDHCLAIGSIAAVARACRLAGRKLRVLWLDAHADFNTAASTPTGNLHGMPVACLCGLGPDALVGFGGTDAPTIAPGAIRQVGVRSVDDGERRLLRAEGVEVHDMHAIDVHGMRAVMERALAGIDEDTHLHVSFDVDFLDPSFAPGVGTAVDGGPTLREARLCMEMIAATGALGSVDIVELNPLADRRNRTAEVVGMLVGALFGQRVLLDAVEPARARETPRVVVEA